MTKYLLFLISFVAFVGCEESLNGDAAPSEMVGTWSAPDLTSKIGSSKPCDGLEVSPQGVSMDLIKIQPDGQLLSAREIIKSAEPYRLDGQLNSAGVMSLSNEAMVAYLGETMEMAKQNGMTVSPNIQLRILTNAIQGKMLEMTIEVTLTKLSLVQTQKFPTRYFLQTTSSGEQALLTKLTKCIED